MGVRDATSVEIGYRKSDITELHTTQVLLREELEVGRKSVGCIEGTIGEQAYSRQGTLMTEQHSMVEVVLPWRFLHLSVLHHVAINHAEAIPPPREYSLKDIVRGESIACIHEQHPLACSHSYALVHRIIYASVGLTDPFCDIILMLMNYINSSVGRLSVYNYQLDVLILLRFY